MATLRSAPERAAPFAGFERQGEAMAALDVWRLWAPDLRGTPVDATRSMAEDRPEDVAAGLTAFHGEG